MTTRRSPGLFCIRGAVFTYTHSIFMVCTSIPGRLFRPTQQPMLNLKQLFIVLRGCKLLVVPVDDATARSKTFDWCIHLRNRERPLVNTARSY